jgi:chromosome segregation protein
MHVIVGQGQLDGVLHATPEERRGFIEEAAGVLKHRKRKEKALRKLEATDGNLVRLGDLLGEIRRQLKPLGRQAEVARRAAVVQADVRDARARLLADDIAAARTALQAELADESALRQRRSEVETALLNARAEEERLDEQLAVDAPRLASAQETWYHLSALRERIRATGSLAAERLRSGADQIRPQRNGRDPDELDAQASSVREEEVQATAQVVQRRTLLDAAVDVRRVAEQAHAAEERRVADLLRAASDQRESRARLTGQVETLRSRVRSADEELGRLAAARDEALLRAERAQHDFTTLETRVAGLDAGESGLDAEYEVAQATLDDLDQQLGKRQEEAAGADRERVALSARVDALELGLTRKDGGGALLAASSAVSGLLGSVAALLSVRTGYEAALAAALGDAADAVAVTEMDAAVRAIEHLRESDLGRAGLIVGGSGSVDDQWPPLPSSAVYAVDVVNAPPVLGAALRRLLHRVAVVADLDAGHSLVRDLPSVVAVTRGGDVLGSHFARGGSAGGPSLIELQAALDEAREQLSGVVHDAERLRFTLSGLEEQRTDAARRVDVALAKLHESDAMMAAVAEELGQLGSVARSARAEAERLATNMIRAEESRTEHARALVELESRLTVTEQGHDEPVEDVRDELAERARSCRAAETEARLALRTAEERARAIAGRAEALQRAARSEREAAAQERRLQERRRRELACAREVERTAQLVLSRLEISLGAAAEQRRSIEASRADAENRTRQVRTLVRDLAGELDTLTDSVHRDEVARAEQRLRIEQLEARAIEELGLDPESLLADYGPDVLVPVDPGPDDENDAAPVAYVREEQIKRLRSAERALALLGRVNPLALEEFAALEERHAFLTEQLEDLRKTRKDLLDIVTDVDARVLEVFAAAWVDVEREFRDVFARLFPGGEGRLLLTDPTDLLNTGIEVEARPPGKKIKRLSLLSGGERSLVAVAFLVSLFKARPSPFYILDEVEAALDDTNLGRLLEIYEELRENSQLVVITHQKRTMEVADALYGVSMRGDGVSTVISQRLRETEPA